jgi:hypothetical protein
VFFSFSSLEVAQEPEVKPSSSSWSFSCSYSTVQMASYSFYFSLWHSLISAFPLHLLLSFLILRGFKVQMEFSE